MKKLSALFFVAIVLLYGKNYAQFSPAWTASFAHTNSLNFSNESCKTAVDAAGNIFVLADVTSDIDPNGIMTTSTYYYSVLIKYDTTGMIVNEQDINVNNLSCSGFDCRGAFGLELDAGGNVYVGYNSYDLANNFDVNISKYDNNLALVWNYRFKPSSIDMGVDLKVASSGTVYAIAKSVSGASTTYHLLSANSNNVSTIPFFSFDTNLDYPAALVLDASQDLYVTGYRMISNYKNVLTASVNSAGVLRWKVTYNGGSANRDDYGTRLVYYNGFVYVIGTSDRGVSNGNDVVAIKYYSSNGKNEWTSLRHFNADDKGYFIYVPSAAFVYLGSVSLNAVLLERLRDATGIPQGKVVYLPEPVRPFSAINGVSLVDMKVSANQNFYLTGTINATDTAAQNFTAAFLAKFILVPNSRNSFKLDFEAPAEGEFDASLTSSSISLDNSREEVYWLRDRYIDYTTHGREIVELVDLDVPSPIKSAGEFDLIHENDFQIYPNPATDILSIFSKEEIVKTELFDVAGKKVKSVLSESENITIDMRDLQQGIYIGMMQTESGEIIARKILKN